MSRSKRPRLVLPIPYEQVPRIEMPREHRLVDGAADIRWLQDPDGLIQNNKWCGAFVWGLFGLVFTSFMCGWGLPIGIYMGWWWGAQAGLSSYVNLLDRIHREHAEALEEEGAAGLTAAKARAKEQTLLARAEKARLREEAQDPVFEGLLGLGYTREEALRGTRATQGETDLSGRLLAALRLLGKTA